MKRVVIKRVYKKRTGINNYIPVFANQEEISNSLFGEEIEPQ